jgi:hypothetical protein
MPVDLDGPIINQAESLFELGEMADDRNESMERITRRGERDHRRRTQRISKRGSSGSLQDNGRFKGKLWLLRCLGGRCV